jgi:hypothetical protein
MALLSTASQCCPILAEMLATACQCSALLTKSCCMSSIACMAMHALAAVASTYLPHRLMARPLVHQQPHPSRPACFAHILRCAADTTCVSAHSPCVGAEPRARVAVCCLRSRSLAVSLSAVYALAHSHSLCRCVLSALSLTRTRWLNLHGAQVRSSGDNWVACAEGFCSAYVACPTASVALLAPPLLSLCLPHRFCCFACLCALLDPLRLPALHGVVRVRFLLSTSHNITPPCALQRAARPQ